MKSAMLSHDMLMGTMRPGRYIDHEWNVVKKDLSKAAVRVCLCFPDVYEVAMSHVGIRILYEVINAVKGVACERAFCPWPDFAKALSMHSRVLASLESQVPLKDFDIVGFSVNNELNYSNIVSMLSLGAIPFRAAERGPEFPLIIAGGNCTLNPEPIAEFFDLFVIGEAEEVLVDILAVCKKFKQKYASLGQEKEGLLLALSQIPGIYVPGFYRVEYKSDHTVNDFAALKKGIPATIKKVWVKDLNKQARPSSWLVPNIAVIHDRIAIEIMRGCMHQCRFCQARSHFFPLRIRSAEHVIAQAKKLYKTSGYEDISLLSLSSSDHPDIEKIVTKLLKYFHATGVSISFPSMRAKGALAGLSHLLSSVRKTGLTFAPEAGTERLRKVLNKNIDINELSEVARGAFEAGYRRIKLYFMIGLPTEQQEDLDGIINLAQTLSTVRKQACGKAAEINMSISTFIPKPHTPFQWAAMAPLQEIQDKQEYLKKAVRKIGRNFRMSFHNPHMSLLEAAFARGNRRCAKVIADAFGAGAQFDQWDEWFHYEVWQNAFLANGLHLEEYAGNPLSLGSTLSWDFIAPGVTKQFLMDEFRKALPSEEGSLKILQPFGPQDEPFEQKNSPRAQIK